MHAYGGYVPVEVLPPCALDIETQKMKLTIKKKLETVKHFEQTLLSMTVYILLTDKQLCATE